jgi:hypothetical protein
MPLDRLLLIFLLVAVALMGGLGAAFLQHFHPGVMRPLKAGIAVVGAIVAIMGVVVAAAPR